MVQEAAGSGPGGGSQRSSRHQSAVQEALVSGPCSRRLSAVQEATIGRI